MNIQIENINIKKETNIDLILLSRIITREIDKRNKAEGIMQEKINKVLNN